MALGADVINMSLGSTCGFSYTQPLSIASVEKADTIESSYLTVGECEMALNDTAEDGTASDVDENSLRFRSLADKELAYVLRRDGGLRRPKCGG